MEHRPKFLSGNLPNIVRERETRHVTAIDEHPGGHLLRVEDFFGHKQYGIPSDRPASDDYHAGDEVLVTDGVNSSRAKVVKADGRPVVVSGPRRPEGRLEARLRRPAAEGGEPGRPGPVPARRLPPAQVPPARDAGLLLGPARPGVGPDPPEVRPAGPAQLRRRPRGPVDRRPAVDDGQGLRPAPRGRPDDHRPRHRPVRRRGPDVPVERVQRAGPGCPSSGGRTGTSCRSSTTTPRTASSARSRTAGTTRAGCSSAGWSWEASSGPTSSCGSSWPTARRGRSR